MRAVMVWSQHATPLRGGESTAFGALWLTPIPAAEREAGACALLLIQDSARGAMRNGERIGPGLHLLRHADRIQLGAQDLWVSVQPEPEETTYDPASHGPDLFCPRLQLRLRPGDPVVICPGPPPRPCGLLYDARAWEAGVRCACGFEPGAPPWHPPTTVTTRRTLDALVALARRDP
jgi:hypothetical protein